jgi:hypothetical protein
MGDRPVTGDHFDAVSACFWPIRARYMHAKEVASYEKENPEL